MVQKGRNVINLGLKGPAGPERTGILRPNRFFMSKKVVLQKSRDFNDLIFFVEILWFSPKNFIGFLFNFSCFEVKVFLLEHLDFIMKLCGSH